MMNDKDLGETLSELTVEHGISLDKLSELTNIPKRYLSAMLNNDLENMPAAPYVRGYIAKICEALDIDQELLLGAYKKIGIKTSGKDDFLPRNRFAITKSKKGWTITIITVVLTIAIATIVLATGGRYFFAGLMGIPVIEVNLPAKVGDMEFLETRDRFFQIQGKINPKDSIIINRESIPVSPDGSFSKEVILDAGLNTFEIKVKRFLGRETTVIRKVLYITENLNEEINNIDYGEETNQEEQSNN
jgi:transcriptional regulator with XRE-family HTH domain